MERHLLKGEKPRNARKVDKVPEGYLPLEGVPNYFYKTTKNLAALDVVKGSRDVTNKPGKKYGDKLISLLQAGYTIDDLVNAKYGTRAGLSRYQDYYVKPQNDYVYIEPARTISYPFVNKVMDERVFYPGGHAAGDYSFEVMRGTVDNVDNTPSKTVSYRPIDAMGKPTGDFYEGIPAGEWSNTIINNGLFTDEKLKKWEGYKTYNAWKPVQKKALGGTVEDLTDEELEELQKIAEERGVTVEEILQILSENSAGQLPENEEDYKYVDFEQELKNMGEYAYGGRTNTNVEVEGNEIVETPDGKMTKMVGPSHEEGGININVPEGSKVFSDRLQIDGKTMQERKMRREKEKAKIGKKLEKAGKYISEATLNGVKRTLQKLQLEEDVDMALQDTINNRMKKNPEKQKMPGGGHVFVDDTFGDAINTANKYASAINAVRNIWGFPVSPSKFATGVPTVREKMSFPKTPLIPPKAQIPTLKKTTLPQPSQKFTTGDYIGMAGTAVSAIGPLLTTLSNAGATPPNINRYKSFGKDAIDSNTQAQSYINRLLGEDIRDIDSSEVSSYRRNAGATSSLNTLRAINAGTALLANEARSKARRGYGETMASLLNSRSQLENIRDNAVMRGESVVDTANKQDIDNYYTSLGSNLEGIGQGIQTIGRNFNISQSNQDTIDLIGLLTANGIKVERDADGKWTLKNV